MLEPDDFKPLNELDELDLYDNKIKDVGQALDTLSKLT
jgi:protein phosphatase 1 regulatory subunit 7